MKKTIIHFSIVIASVIGACNHSSNQAKNFHSIDTNKLAKGDTYYQCSMHPDEISDTAQTCPVCDDEMEKHTKQ